MREVQLRMSVGVRRREGASPTRTNFLWMTLQCVSKKMQHQEEVNYQGIQGWAGMGDRHL